MRRVMLAVVGVVGLLVAVSLAPSAASTLGAVSSARLDGFVGTGPSGAPVVYASDNFTGTAGSSLNGRSLVVGGQPWVVAAGTWTINGTQAGINGVPLGRAVAAAGRSDVRVAVTVADSGQGGRTSGVVFRSDATASTYLSTYTQNGSGGRIYLAKRSGTSSTTLTTYTGVSFTNPATFVVECNGSTVKVIYNGVTYITYTLSAADQLVYGGLGSHGLLNDNAALVHYDDFRVESL